MKKITLALSVILMVVLLAFSAVAAPLEYETDANNAFDVTYTGTAGAYYAIVAVKGIVEEGTAPTITESSIQYIDQKTADANGTVTFEDILLKVDGTAATIFLGGSDRDSALLLGWVNKVETVNYTVSGKVTSASSSAATVTLTDLADNTKTYTVNTTAGTYSVTVPAGSYKYVVTKAKHLSYTDTELAVEADVTKDVTIVGGDVNADNVIDFDDLSNVLLNYGTETQDGDVNEDGLVDFDDLSAVLINYQDIPVVE